MSTKKKPKSSRSVSAHKISSRSSRSDKKGGDKLNSLEEVEDDNLESFNQSAAHKQKRQKMMNLPICDEQITKMRISCSNLRILREESESKRNFNPIKETQYITVRKIVKDNNARRQRVQVLRPAPKEAKLRVINITRYRGPKLDKYGRLNPHSILGEVEDFKKEALKRGEFLDLLTEKPVKTATGPPKKSKLRVQKVLNSKNCILTWEREMEQWRKQISHLTGCINRDAGNMLMTKSENARTVQERKELNSYKQDVYPDIGFWRLPRWCGPEEYCIGNTLTKHENGYPTCPSMSGDTTYIQAEKGNIQANYISQFWSHLEKEISGMPQGTIHIMDIAKFKDLGVFTRPINTIPSKKGEVSQIEKHLCNSDGQRLVDFDKSSENEGATCGSCEEAVSAPALVFMGTLLPWMGPRNPSLDTDAAMVTALTFDGLVGDLLTQSLEMSNSGSTVVHFHIRIIYLLTENIVYDVIIGVLLPGESIKIRVIFKSKKPGYFSQTWRVLTQPIFCGGRTPQVTLKAVIMSRPEHAPPIEEIKDLLHHREAQMIVKDIVQIWMKGILGFLEMKEKQVPLSPLNDPFSEEDVFVEANPRFYYKFTEVQQLLTLSEETAQYVQDTTTKDLLTQPQYCLSLAFLRKVMSELPEDLVSIECRSLYVTIVSPERISRNMPKISKSCQNQTNSTAIQGKSTISVKDELLERLARIAEELSFSPMEMIGFQKRQKYYFGQGLIRMALDRMTTQVLYIANTFNQTLIWDVDPEPKIEEASTLLKINPNTLRPIPQKRSTKSAPAVAASTAKAAHKGQKVDTPAKSTQQPEQHPSTKKDVKRKRQAELFSSVMIPVVQASQARKSTHNLLRGTLEFELFHEKIEMMVYKILKSTVMNLVDLLEGSNKGQEVDVFVNFRNKE